MRLDVWKKRKGKKGKGEGKDRKESVQTKKRIEKEDKVIKGLERKCMKTEGIKGQEVYEGIKGLERKSMKELKDRKRSV